MLLCHPTGWMVEKQSHVNHHHQDGCVRIKIWCTDKIATYPLNLALITLNHSLGLMWGVHICLIFRHFYKVAGWIFRV